MSDELYNYLTYTLRKQIKDLDGFVQLGNEIDRQKRLKKLLDEVILIKHRPS